MTEPVSAAEALPPTAGILVIGDEILSGRTKDRNIGTIADFLTERGIDLKEVRIVPDEEDRIIEAVQALSRRWTYVFTTGGIGPTHDDITADAVARAFGVGIDIDPRARALLRANYASDDDLTPARLRMARIPFGADLIENRISRAPGFRIGNVHVMAGVPSVMAAMLEAIDPWLAHGTPMLSETYETRVPEGLFGDDLKLIAEAHPDVAIGSYPFHAADGRHAARLVVRSRDPARLAAVGAEVAALVARLTPAA
ncbi:competence/damage-inducible protein A [Segnochrobactraceae bacterium EtOH-i3]